jgi:hypothetical protein
MEMSGQLHAPAALPPGKEPRYPLDRTLGGPQSRSGRRKNSWPYRDSNSDSLVIQPVASRYTNYAIQASRLSLFIGKLIGLNNWVSFQLSRTQLFWINIDNNDALSAEFISRKTLKI